MCRCWGHLEAKDRSWPPWSDREDPGEKASSLYLGRRASAEAFPSKEGGVGSIQPCLPGRGQEGPAQGGSVWAGGGATEGMEPVGPGGASDGRGDSQLLRSSVLPRRVEEEEGRIVGGVVHPFSFLLMSTTRGEVSP